METRVKSSPEGGMTNSTSESRSYLIKPLTFKILVVWPRLQGRLLPGPWTFCFLSGMLFAPGTG